MASRVASKSSKWLKDPSTYPLFVCIGAGAILCFGVGVRHLTTSPDVKWNRDVRKNPELALQIDRSGWTTHRDGFKNLHRNAVNDQMK
jgi:hypothetical protein